MWFCNPLTGCPCYYNPSYYFQHYAPYFYSRQESKCSQYGCLEKHEQLPGTLKVGYFPQSSNLDRSRKQLVDNHLEMMSNAHGLTQNLSSSLNACKDMMTGSSLSSQGALLTGQNFNKFAGNFGNCAMHAMKFVSTMKYPDFDLVTHPKPTFTQENAYENINEDFERHMSYFPVEGMLRDDYDMDECWNDFGYEECDDECEDQN